MGCAAFGLHTFFVLSLKAKALKLVRPPANTKTKILRIAGLTQASKRIMRPNICLFRE